MLPAAILHGQVPPPPQAWVTDSASFLSPARLHALDARLRAYEETSGHQVFVWIGKTSGGEPIDSWAEKTFRSWQVGRKGIDDGLVLFVLAEDRTARIEVGYGLEDKLPDAVASRIIRDDLIPGIKRGDHDGAISAAVDKVLGSLGGEKGGEAPGLSEPNATEMGVLLLVLLGVVILGIRYPAFGRVLLWILWSASGRRGSAQSSAQGRGGRSGGGGASGRW